MMEIEKKKNNTHQMNLHIFELLYIESIFLFK